MTFLAVSKTSDCTKETDEPESNISSTSAPPNFPSSTVAEDFIAATVIIVGVLSSWICGVIVGLNSWDACCPVQVPRWRFPGANNLWRDGPISHSKNIFDCGNHVVDDQSDCN